MVGNNDKRGGQSDANQNTDDGGHLSRRNLLKSSATAAVGAAGVKAATGSAAAYDEAEEDKEIGDYLELAECGFGWASGDGFNVVDLDPWWGDYDPNFDVGRLSDEICIYVHGFGAAGLAAEQGETLANNIYFDGDFLSAKWPSVTPTYTQAWDRAAEYGRKLADWLIDELWPQNGWTKVNVVGHSLGGRASFNMLNRLHEELPWWEYDRVGNVVTVGPADHQRFVCDRWESGDRIYHYYDGIQSVPDNAYAFYSSSDEAVGTLHELWADLLWWTPDGEGLGADGVSCSNAPDNLTTVDVSAGVSNHCQYFKSEGAPGRVESAVWGDQNP
ncbi:esterase/lipase family protein [Halovenus sp. HT40]|uniref:esterase/lipase family protein n=1 Tax=Halovenus sp. HT40 TaxID=3126691 RepID=UPI00300E9902